MFLVVGEWGRDIRGMLSCTDMTRIQALLLTVSFLCLPAVVSAAEIKLDLTVERKPALFFGGKPRPVHEFIAAMAQRTAGRTDFSLRVVPQPLYHIAAVLDNAGRYRVDPQSLQLATSVTAKARIAIRYPTLSAAQFNALRNTRDYRLLFGLIRGIVEHEELHAREFTNYARTVRSLYAVPPLGSNPDPIVDPNGDVDAVLARYVQDRTREALDAAKRASDARQRAIDQTGKTTSVLFRFTDAIDDEVPVPVIYRTKGKFRVKFEVPKGSPRPPEPRLRYP